MSQNKQHQQESLALVLIVIVVVVVVVTVGICTNWTRNGFFISLSYSTIIGLLVYTFRPRKCLNCKIYMKRNVTKSDRVIYTCKKCGKVIDTKVGLNTSP